MSSTDTGSFDVEDYVRHMMSRRSVLKFGAAAGTLAAGAMLDACTAGPPPTASGPGGKSGAKGGAGGQPASAPAQSATLPTPRAQTVIIGAGQFVSYGVYNPFVPNVDYANGAGQVLKEYFYYLNLTKPTDNLITWQSTGWEYNKSFTQATFHLDPKVHWNDGQPFTSADVRFTLELFKKHPELSLNGLVYNVAEAYQQAESIKTPDPHTIVINLTQSNARYHYNFICSVIGAFLVVPEHTWSKIKDPTTFKNDPPVFTGPYKLKEANRTLQYYLWEKDPNYWNKDTLDPAPQYAAWITKPAADAAAQDFKNAKYDQGANYDQTRVLIQNGYKNALITKMIDPCPRAFLINCDKSKGILADPRMRWVVSSLINREYIATSVWPLKAPVATYPWAGYQAMQPWNLPDIAAKYPLKYDPAKAASLLDEMGAKKGSGGKRSYQGKPIKFTIINPGPNTAPEYLSGQLLVKEFQKLGIDADLKALTGPGVYQAAVTKGDYDIRAEWGACTVIDPYQTYQDYTSTYYTPIGKNATSGDDVRLKDPKLDHVVGQLSGTKPKAGEPLYATALDAWYNAMPVIPYIQTLYTHQANTTYWTGWPTDDNLYMVPNNWWGQFMFVIGKLKPTGKK